MAANTKQHKTTQNNTTTQHQPLNTTQKNHQQPQPQPHTTTTKQKQVPVINHFLRDLEANGRYTGFCELGASWQNLENAGARAALGLPPGLTGVLVTKADALAPAAAALKRGDVLTHLAGTPIADDGTFLFREAVRIDFRHIAACAFDGDEVEVRGGGW